MTAHTCGRVPLLVVDDSGSKATPASIRLPANVIRAEGKFGPLPIGSRTAVVPASPLLESSKRVTTVPLNGNEEQVHHHPRRPITRGEGEEFFRGSRGRIVSTRSLFLVDFEHAASHDDSVEYRHN